MFLRYLPSAKDVRTNPALRWMGPLLDRPWLWKANRRTISSGAAIGLFFGMATPIAQIPLAAVAAIALRANLPVAVLCTLVSNPFTFVPILVLAYAIGGKVLGADATAGLPTSGAWADKSFDYWLQNAGGIAEPLLVGMLLLASASALIVYAAVSMGWRFVRLMALRRRRVSTLA